MANIFTDMLNKGLKAGVAGVSKAASRWYRDMALSMTNVSASRLFRERDNLQKSITPKDIGSMFMFYYDPKYKKTLPYYDRLPLIIVVDFAPGGFYGLNLHYLPPKLRAILMDALWGLRNNDKYDETTRLQITYQELKRAAKYRYFAPCFKHYLVDHVQSSFLYIHPADWDKALMLPFERFEKQSKDYVHKESQRNF